MCFFMCPLVMYCVDCDPHSSCAADFFPCVSLFSLHRHQPLCCLPPPNPPSASALQYFAPYKTLHLSAMASAFDTTVEVGVHREQRETQSVTD